MRRHLMHACAVVVHSVAPSVPLRQTTMHNHPHVTTRYERSRAIGIFNRPTRHTLHNRCYTLARHTRMLPADLYGCPHTAKHIVAAYRSMFRASLRRETCDDRQIAQRDGLHGVQS